ncbi:MAG TPA: hypothetical protein VFE51_17775, partial [Verrucomicrobiae bacterium]|nr:hypothetical protein [Verrucomicrobiae bacterium]
MVRVTSLGWAALLASWLCLLQMFGGEPESPEAGRRAINLEALSRLKGIDLEANPAVKAVVLKLLDQVRGTPQFVEIVRDFKIQGQAEPLLAIAAKDPAGPSGAEAMRLVLESGDTNPVLSALAATNAAGVVEALGNTGEKGMVPLLRPIVPDRSRPVELRKKA